MSRFKDSLSKLGQLLSGTPSVADQARSGKIVWPDDIPSANAVKASPEEIMEMAVAVLEASSSPMLSFTRDEAVFAMNYLMFEEAQPGTVIMAEGDKDSNDFVAILLAGEVRVETTLNPGYDPQIFSLRTKGSAMGAVGFLDGLPRWGTHTAATAVIYATLTRAALKELLVESPIIGAKFLLAIAQMLAEAQRDYIARLKILTKINRSLQEENLADSDRHVPR